MLAELDDALLKAQLDQSVAQLESARPARAGVVNYARAGIWRRRAPGRAALDEAAASLAHRRSGGRLG